MIRSIARCNRARLKDGEKKTVMSIALERMSMERMSMERISILKFAYAVVFVLVPALAVAQDKVYPNNGVAASGKIVQLTPDAVKIEVRGKNQDYELQEVRKIQFSGEPKELDRARDSFNLEQYDQALEDIKKIDASKIKNTLVRQDVEFYRYYCSGKLALAGQGDKANAIRGLVALQNLNGNTHHLYDLSEMLGALAMAIGKPDQAARFYGKLANAKNNDTKALGVYRLGEVELMQGNTQKARQRFLQLVGISSNSEEMQRLKRLGQVGLASCEVVEGKHDAALKKLGNLVKNNDSTDQALFSRIYNAMGSAHLAKGDSVQALLSYLKTDYLYFKESEAHAEALYHLKKLFPQVGENGKAADAGARLNSLYGSSVWANKS